VSDVFSINIYYSLQTLDPGSHCRRQWKPEFHVDSLGTLQMTELGKFAHIAPHFHADKSLSVQFRQTWWMGRHFEFSVVAALD
jgi:hypothetical protein